MVELVNEALKSGIWAGLSVFLIFYNMKVNEKQEKIQTLREESYLKIIDDLTTRLSVINEMQKDIIEVRQFIEMRKKKVY